jgi:hypothetical protein
MSQLGDIPLLPPRRGHSDRRSQDQSDRHPEDLGAALRSSPKRQSLITIEHLRTTPWSHRSGMHEHPTRMRLNQSSATQPDFGGRSDGALGGWIAFPRRHFLEPGDRMTSRARDPLVNDLFSSTL